MRIYAYVTSQTCIGVRAVRPGETIGGIPVSRRGDYEPWYHGKRETIKLASGAPWTPGGPEPTVHRMTQAVMVRKALGWRE